MAQIDVRDIGAVGARIFLDPAPHAGKTYEFTGALTTYNKFADAFSQVLGRKITYPEKTLEQSEQSLKARGTPDWLIARMVTLGKIGPAAHYPSKTPSSSTTSSSERRSRPSSSLRNRGAVCVSGIHPDCCLAFLRMSIMNYHANPRAALVSQLEM